MPRSPLQRRWMHPCPRFLIASRCLSFFILSSIAVKFPFLPPFLPSCDSPFGKAKHKRLLVYRVVNRVILNYPVSYFFYSMIFCFDCAGPLLPCMGSWLQHRGFSSFGARAQLLCGSQFPNQGLHLCPLHQKVDSLHKFPCLLGEAK